MGSSYNTKNYLFCLNANNNFSFQLIKNSSIKLRLHSHPLWSAVRCKGYRDNLPRLNSFKLQTHSISPITGWRTGRKPLHKCPRAKRERESYLTVGKYYSKGDSQSLFIYFFLEGDGG